ncbi:MAG TPA: SagB/ThcOx family dehydrogenase [Nitrospiria bacterium]|nr:SagB/ThcOx family dehydrogenase [Nitrospiria bacterium]
MPDDLKRVLAYHQAGKHRLDRYAPGPHNLDWGTQPDPFRRYTGAPLIRLEHVPPEDLPLYEPSFMEGRLPVQPLDRMSVSQLFYDSLAISAWKKAGDVSWALRVNPSSGNLHPTEGYLICGPISGLCDRPMVCHYAPKIHALERRVEFSLESWKGLTARLPEDAILVGLTSIHWREAWKYGERAFRYCQHDAGHAIAAISLAAAGLGWKATLLDELSTDSLADLLGVFDPQGVEAEQPECLLAVSPQGKSGIEPALPLEVTENFKRFHWQGRPNRLSPGHVEWPMIEETAAATRKPVTRRIDGTVVATGGLPEGEPAPISFRKMIHQRRSCLALNGRTGITRDALYHILMKTLPAPGRFPFNTIPWPPRIHLALFLHRVQNLDPGIYFLVRDPSRMKLLSSAMKKEFAWEKPEGCPPALEFHRLLTGDTREISQQIACHQEIASDGCFSLGMIADFEKPLNEYGAWFYPRLFWESGLVGQVLYLEAESLGLRGTGIGCFFDDPMHSFLGLEGFKYQDLYHFTMGGHVEDPRLTTLPAYPSTSGNPE